MAEEATKPPTTTLKDEIVMIAMFSAIAVGFHVWALVEFSESYWRGEHSLPSILMVLVVWLGQALWISMDRRRRGHEVGMWRFLVLLIGPIAVWLYLLQEYGLRGLLFVLYSFIPYGAVLLVPAIVAMLLRPHVV